MREGERKEKRLENCINVNGGRVERRWEMRTDVRAEGKQFEEIAK